MGVGMKLIDKVVNYIGYYFGWMDVLFSPFKFPKPVVHIGKVSVGTPYMLPRVWIKSINEGYLIPVPKKVGFDTVPLGFKWKYEDLRHEWNPVWSFVICNLQIAVIWHLNSHFWESYLTYRYRTNNKDKTLNRLIQSRNKNPNIWVTQGSGKENKKIDYFMLSLKIKWRKKLNTRSH